MLLDCRALPPEILRIRGGDLWNIFGCGIDGGSHHEDEKVL